MRGLWDDFFIDNLERGLKLIGAELTEEEESILYTRGVPDDLIVSSRERFELARMASAAIIAQTLGERGWNIWREKSARALKAAFDADLEEVRALKRMDAARRSNLVFVRYESPAEVAHEWNQRYNEIAEYGGHLALVVAAKSWDDLYGRRDMKRVLLRGMWPYAVAMSCAIVAVAWWLF